MKNSLKLVSSMPYTSLLQVLTLSGSPAGETDSASHLPHQGSQPHHHKQSPELHTFLTWNRYSLYLHRHTWFTNLEKSLINLCVWNRISYYEMFNFTFHDVATLCVEKCLHISEHFQLEYAVEGNMHQYIITLNYSK